MTKSPSRIFPPLVIQLPNSFRYFSGEGVSRRKWRAAVTSAMRAGAVEVWVMEHDRLAKSWLNRSAWPIGHDSNPPREDGSEFFTLTELRAEVQSLARRHCDSRTSMLASCRVPSSRRDRRRNLLVGVQCNCLSRADRPLNAELLRSSSSRSVSSKSVQMKIGLVGDVMLGHTGGGFSKLRKIPSR